MCAVCGLPSTHINTISTISLISLSATVLGTFVWYKEREYIRSNIEMLQEFVSE